MTQYSANRHASSRARISSTKRAIRQSTKTDYREKTVQIIGIVSSNLLIPRILEYGVESLLVRRESGGNQAGIRRESGGNQAGIRRESGGGREDSALVCAGNGL